MAKKVTEKESGKASSNDTRIRLIREELRAEREGLSDNPIPDQEPIESQALAPPTSLHSYGTIAPHLRPTTAPPAEPDRISLRMQKGPQPIERALDFLLENEGGFSNHPSDGGGKTNFGISKKYHPEAWESGPPTKAMAEQIYRDQYWVPIRGDDLAEIDPDIATAVMDTAVLFGPQRAIRMLQRAVGEAEDGIVGPLTLSAVGEADKRALLRSIADERISSHNAKIARDPSQSVFRGWFTRAERVASLGAFA